MSPQARAERSVWAREQDDKIWGALDYYLGPTGIPDKLRGAVGLLDYTDAGDMKAAADANRDFVANPSIASGMNLAATVAAAGLPFVGAKMYADGVDVMGDAIRSGKDDILNYLGREDGAIKAWHGSPHDFDKFSMDKIGTGEGAQAYGHGLYFAENRPTAEFYRDNYAKPDRALFSTDSARQMAQDQLQAWAGDIPGGIDDLKASLGNMERTAAFFKPTPDEIARMQDLREAISYMESGAPLGRLYEVEINANPEDFLDWDGEITNAPTEFQDWVRRRMDEVPLKEGSRAQRQLQNWRAAPGDWQASDGVNVPPPRVAEVRNWLGQYGEDQVGMTDSLREAGIPGIRYLDQGSRGAGDGTRNYVVFDENLISIVKKYGIAGAAAMLGMSAQEVQAQVGNATGPGVSVTPEVQNENKRELREHFKKILRTSGQ